MIKNWKSLFLKSEESAEKETKPTEPLSFPVNKPSDSFPVAEPYTEKATFDPVVNEVIQVYESGLDSINMPGYDFYEFYKTIASTGVANEQTYKMAYQMAKSLDKTITPEKLTKDAEFYVSKISEVHGQYVSQGQQKLNSLQQEKSTEKTKLMTEVDQASIRIAHLKVELQQLESDVNSKKTVLAKIDETYYPKEKAIKEKLNANDLARKTSVDKLSSIKEGILRYIKI